MFTLLDIQAAHKKVKSGADFPEYIRDIITLGVREFKTFVTDGKTTYLGDQTTISGPILHESLTIDISVNKEKFIDRLRFHQSGGSDFLTFCQDCATSGIDHWIVRTHEHTCTYYDHA